MLLDSKENIVNERVQQQHFTLAFIYMENVVRQVFFVVLL